MNDQNRREICLFRFFGLNSSQAKEFEGLAGDIKVRRHKGVVENTFVVSMFLEESSNYQWVITFLEKNKFAREDYGFFVSLRTDEDSAIMRMPTHAADLFRLVGGVIDFSFTSIS